jgi:hypothetical protein
VIAKYRPKIVIGGPGAWQLERAERLDEFNVDYLIDGEIERVFSELFKRIMAGDPTARTNHQGPEEDAADRRRDPGREASLNLRCR